MVWRAFIGLFIGLQSVCANYTHILHLVENQKKIPEKLLTSIACVESGQRQNGKHTPWPWTINVHGKGYTFKTKAEAIAAVRNFQQKGYDSIDIGLMQINLKHHPKAFNNLDEAFDPHTNVSYAGKFLYDLYLKHGSWYQAVRHYHSANAQLNHQYLQKVLKAWAKVKTLDSLQSTHSGPMKSPMLNFNHIPHRDVNGKHNVQTNLSTQSNKTIPITVSFFPLKLNGEKTEHARQVKASPGAVAHNARVFPVEFKKVHTKQRTTQTLRTIPLTLSPMNVMPLR